MSHVKKCVKLGEVSHSSFTNDKKPLPPAAAAAHVWKRAIGIGDALSWQIGYFKIKNHSEIVGGIIMQAHPPSDDGQSRLRQVLAAHDNTSKEMSLNAAQLCDPEPCDDGDDCHRHLVRKLEKKLREVSGCARCSLCAPVSTRFHAD